MLTLPTSPQDQFLCLAVQKGSLLLLYDFGAGLMKAEPPHKEMEKLLAMTTASKAVRLGSGVGSGRTRGTHGSP